MEHLFLECEKKNSKQNEKFNLPKVKFVLTLVFFVLWSSILPLIRYHMPYWSEWKYSHIFTHSDTMAIVKFLLGRFYYCFKILLLIKEVGICSIVSIVRLWRSASTFTACNTFSPEGHCYLS